MINAYSDETRQVLRLREALEMRGVNIEVVRNNISLSRLVCGSTGKKPDFDFCVYLDKDKYVSHILEKQGVRLFNTATAIENCDDKMTTHIILSDNGIPMPDTLGGLMCYYPDAEVKPDALDFAEQKLGYPMIIKHAYGSMGKGVFKADNRAELNKIAADVKLYPHLYQKYIASSFGVDLRVIVVGQKVLGGILRKSDGDFRSNIGLGGKAEKAEVPKSVEVIALKAAEILGLDYCGLDFLLGDTPLLCEVNSNAFFDAFEHATGVDVAGAYADHIIKSLLSLP